MARRAPALLGTAVESRFGKKAFFSGAWRATAFGNDFIAILRVLSSPHLPVWPSLPCTRFLYRFQGREVWRRQGSPSQRGGVLRVSIHRYIVAIYSYG